MAFVAWTIGDIVLAAHMRSERQPLLRTNAFANRPFPIWAGASLSIVIIGLNVPFLEERLYLLAPSLSMWAVACAAALLLPCWWEVWKWARR